MVAQFDEQIVIKKYLAAIEEILAKRGVKISTCTTQNCHFVRVVLAKFGFGVNN